MKARIFSALSFFSLAFNHVTLPLVKGSQAVVTVESHVVFPASDTDNTIGAFGWFQNGFSLEDASTTCTFQSVYPVSGVVDLNGGSLYLDHDLTFKNPTVLQGLGSIWGNGRVLQLPATPTALPLDTVAFHDTVITCESDAFIQSTITFYGNCSLCGNNNDVVLSEGAEIVLAPGATLELCHMNLKGVSGTNVRCLDDSAQLILDEMSWIQDGDFTFGLGSFKILDQVNVLGAHVFSYESSQTSTVSERATLRIADEACLRIGRNSAESSVEPLYFKDETATLHLDHCSIVIAEHGAQFTRGTIVFEHDVGVDIVATTTDCGMVVGNGVSDDDIRLQFNAGATVTHNSGQLVFNGGSPDIMKSSAHKNVRLMRTENSFIYVAQDFDVPPITLELSSLYVPPMVLAPGKELHYNGSVIVLPTVEFDFTGNQLSAYTYALNGFEEVSFSRGVLPLNLNITGVGNVLKGIGSVAGLVTLQDSATQLTCAIAGRLMSGAVLSGGTISLASEFGLEGDTVLTGSGLIDLGSNIFNFGAQESVWTSTLIWNGDGAQLDLHADITLTTTWLFNGSCVINGNGNTLHLGSTGALAVADGATLFLKNIQVDGLAGENLQCLGDTSVIKLDDVRLVCVGDVVMAHGSMNIFNDIEFFGPYTFAYDSSQTSTINQHSHLRCGDDMRFKLGRHSLDAANPLYFKDRTSEFILDQASLHVSGSGAQFTNGTVILEHDVILDVDGTDTLSGMIIGNGNAEEDLLVQFNAGSTVKHNTGVIVFNGGTPNFLRSRAHKNVRMVRTENSFIHIAQDFINPPITVELESIFVPPVSIEPGKILTYNDAFVVLPGVEFDFTGLQLSASTYLLPGYGEISFTKGLLPLAIVVQNVGNLVQGNGGFSGYIILKDSNAQLISNIDGVISNNVILNGGSITLASDLDLAGDSVFTGSGTLDLSAQELKLGTQDSLWTGTLAFIGDSATIDMNANVSLLGTWTVSGVCLINGNNNTLDLNGIGEIVVDRSSTLVLKNVRLDGVSGTNIRCLDDQARLILDDMAWVQDADFSFTTGSMTIIDHVDFLGASTFAYESTQTSTITSHGCWRVAEGMHFKMGRSSATTAIEPLYFEDQVAMFNLDHGVFQVTGHGMQLTRGILVFDRDVALDIDGTTTANGLIIGSGSADDDPLLRLNGSAAVSHNSGYVTFKSANPHVVQAATERNARLIRTPGSYLWVEQDLILPQVILELTSIFVPPVGVEEGRILQYDNSGIVMPGVQFDITSNQLDAYTYLLNGGDSLFFDKGILPLNLAIHNAGNTIQGNAGVKGLISFGDSNAQLISKINGPISTNIELNNGLLSLRGPMRLQGDTIITGSGRVDLDTFSLILGPQDALWTDTLEFKGRNGFINLNAKTSLSGKWVIDGRCGIRGNGNTLHLSDLGEIVINPGSRLLLRNMRIDGLKESNLHCLSDDSVLVLNDVSWAQDDNFTFTMGSMEFVNNVQFIGSSGLCTFSYESAQTSTIASDSEWCLSDNINFAVGKHEENGVEPICLTDDSSQIKLDNCTLTVVNPGFKLTHGKGIFSRNVEVDILSSNTSDGLIIGNGDSAHDTIIQFNPGSNVNLSSGHFVYNNGSPTHVRSLSKSARLLRGASSNIYIAQDATFPEMTLALSSYLVPPIEIATGKILGYADTRISLPTAEFDVTSNRYDFMTFYLDGYDELFLSKGDFPLNIRIANIGNQIHGNGNILGVIYCEDSSSRLLIDLYGQIEQAPSLNGGTFTLGGNLQMGGSAIVNGPGILDLGIHEFSLGVNDLVWTSSLSWQGNGGMIDLNSRVSLSGTWTVNGNCVLNGNGNTLVFEDTGCIAVSPNSKLSICNVRLSGISQDSIVCFDDSAQLVLDDVVWVQDSNYTFSVGSILFKDAVELTGAYTFAYESLYTSTIDLKSELTVSNGMYFAMGRTQEGGADPLYLEGLSSGIRMSNSRLCVCQYGLRLTHGSLLFDRDVIIDIDSTSTANGLLFGDGTSEGDMIVELYPGASVRFTGGHATYDVTSGNGIRSRSASSKLIRHAGSVFHLNQDLTLSEITIDADPLAYLTIADGKSLFYDDTVVESSYGEFLVKGARYNFFTTLLNGNDFVFLKRGIFPAYILAKNASNLIQGNGNISGLLTLADSNAAVSWVVNGMLANNVVMNGGLFDLDCDVRLSRDYQFTGSGSVHLCDNRCVLGANDMNWTGTTYWDGNGGSVHLNSHLVLSGMWTFSGQATLTGNGNVLELGETGQLNIEKGSCLHCKDIVIKRIKDGNICCLDDSANIVLDNTTWVQDGNMTFSQGSVMFLHDVIMRGPATFAYQSLATSTICAYSSLTIDEMFTFSYDPIFSADKNCFEFEDNTASLVLRDATLCATATGLQFTKGKCFIQGTSCFETEVVEVDGQIIVDEGITFGDGTLENDCRVNIGIGATLHVGLGSLIYNNIGSKSWTMGNQLSIIKLHEDTTFKVNENLNLGLGTLHKHENSHVFIAAGKEIVGSTYTVN